MKKLALIVFAFIVLPTIVMAKDSTDRTILVTRNSLVCDYFHLKKAEILLGAGDFDALAAYISMGYCVRTRKSIYATALEDTSSYSDDSAIEFTVAGESVWVAKRSTICCFRRNDAGEWKRIDAVNVSNSPNEGTKCAKAKEHIQELKGAGFAGSAQYNNWADYIANNCR